MECSICMNHLNEAPDNLFVNPLPAKKTTTITESIIVATPCGHIFHRACLKGWLKETTGSCPKCRRQFTMKSAHPLFLDFQNMYPTDPLSNSSKEFLDELVERYLVLKKEHHALEDKYGKEKGRADLNEAIVKSLGKQSSGNSSSHDSSNVTKIDFTNKKESSQSNSKTALKKGDRVIWIRNPMFKNAHGKVIRIGIIGNKDAALVKIHPVSHFDVESLCCKYVPLTDLVLEESYKENTS